MTRAGVSVNVAVGCALVALLLADWYFDFSAVMALMAPVILIGGMTLGWFTPTEAAMAAVIWALFLGLVRYRSMTLKSLARATIDTIETTASVLFIVTAASIFAWLLTVSQAAQVMTDAILGFTQNKWMFLLLANVLILIVGCFIDTIAAITILVPILLPIVLKLGIDPIHFGLIMVLNLMIGLLHPPLGMVLFVLARVARLSVERTTMAILPWLVPLFAALIAITYIPEITLWLPKPGGGRKVAPSQSDHLKGNPMTQRLANKIALVTAAGQGIGRATAEAFAREGARVVATDINEALLGTLVLPAGCSVRRLDVTDAAAISALAGELGGIDILFNCAGYVDGGTILDCDDRAWDFSFDLNVRAMYRMMRDLPARHAGARAAAPSSTWPRWPAASRARPTASSTAPARLR